MENDLSGSTESPVTKWLRTTNGFAFTVFATLSAFCLYTCIYAFRKTFAAATFDGLTFAGINYKVWLVTFQVAGYALSKFIGIKIVSELAPKSRALGILLTAAVAALSWLLFALVSPPYNMIFLALNGLSLGLTWGMVLGYLEGRRFTEVLGAGLSVSFIFSAGICKSVGGYIMRDWKISAYWMPLVACGLFTVPLLFFLWLLNKVPPPTALDEQLRTKRQPMNRADRLHFVRSFAPGIVLFVLAYMLLTTFRECRDNFSAEVWKSLGYGNSPEIFTKTETPVSILILVSMGGLMLIKNNKLALMVNHVYVIVGMLLIGVSTYFFEMHLIQAPLWMILIGLGLYLGYVPFNSFFFDRLLATFKYVGTVGFIMYVADSFGYLGSVTVLFLKEFSHAQLAWLNFFINTGYVVSVIGTLLMGGSMWYFHRKHQRLMEKF